MNCPRTLFVAPSAYPYGGVQTWLDYLLPGLGGRGWEPILGLVAGRFHDVARYVEAHPGHEYVAIPNPTGSREGRIRSLIQTIRSVQPQLVVSVNICDCYAAIERMRARGLAAPHIAMTDHSVGADYLLDARSWRHVIDGLIGTNLLTQRLAQDYAGLDAQRVHYAPYGVLLETAEVARHQTNGGPLRIAYSGRVDEQQKRAQDIPAILEALERAGVDYRFRLAGDGPYLPKLRERLLPQIERGRVELLGVLDAQNLDRRLYAWAQALFVTSFWETGPIVIWEAMARNLPVVSSRYIGSGLEGSLRHEENCLLFPIGDASAAAAQLARLTDAALRESLAQEGRALVARRYSREQSVTEWDACLRRVVEKPSLAFTRSVTRSFPSGRLDRWIGNELAETVRRLLGRAHAHQEPGGEWPHSDNDLSMDDMERFWAMAGEKDAAR